MATYSKTIGGDSQLYEKQYYFMNKICALLPVVFGYDVPYILVYSYLPAGERIVLEGSYIKVSVQYAEQLDEEELYKFVRRAIHDSRPDDSSLLYSGGRYGYA